MKLFPQNNTPPSARHFLNMGNTESCNQYVISWKKIADTQKKQYIQMHHHTGEETKITNKKKLTKYQKMVLFQTFSFAIYTHKQ